MSTNQVNDGGPAFPHSSQPLDGQGNPLCEEHSEWGMTLRDYFAAKAMQGTLSNPDATGSTAEHAQWAYEIADAMLKAREGGAA